MPRNYKNEQKWADKKYERFVARIDKKIGIEFKSKLKEKNVTFANWLAESIASFLQKK